jgi:hypothetical protein
MNRTYSITIALSECDIEHITEELHQRPLACKCRCGGYTALDYISARAWNQVYLSLTGQDHSVFASQFGHKAEVAI